jgi:uncharacterized protein YprB with RNaseH-like and TPR domain
MPDNRGFYVTGGAKIRKSRKGVEMPEDLRARLSRIRELRRGLGSGPVKPTGEHPEPAGRPEPAGQESVGKREATSGTGLEPELWGEDWATAGFMTLSRREIRELPIPVPQMSPDLGILSRDFTDLPDPASLLFFDLETTGLSGGAGTLAFLAAFGRLVKTGAAGEASGFGGISLTQYLLLDYPGEGDFLEAVRGEFRNELALSYNGKNFDAQILKNRWLMNGIVPAEYGHGDLLYPARRLWRRVLPDCSQGTIEREILGLSRAGDVGGAFAPEIWFDFLKQGGTGPLLKICEHNLRDILGLASLFACLCNIAGEPRKAREKYRADGEGLALLWSYAARQGRADPELARKLLEAAAEEGYPRACRRLAVELEWGRGAALPGKPVRDLSRALALTERALERRDGNLSGSVRKDLESRRDRLLKKLGRATERSGDPG